MLVSLSGLFLGKVSGLTLVFTELTASFSGLLRGGGPLIKGGGSLGLAPCDDPVGLITEVDINGGGPSGLTDSLTLVPGGDVSLLALREAGVVVCPPTETEREMELELLPSGMDLTPVIGMSGGGLGTRPVVIPYRGPPDIPGDTPVGLGGDESLGGEVMPCPVNLA